MKQLSDDYFPTGSTEHADFYNDFWRDKSGHNNDRERLICEAVKQFTSNSNASIVDIGCGVGWLTAELSEFGKVLGVDYSPTAIARARSTAPHCDFEVLDILNSSDVISMPRFDIGVCSEVIEHIPRRNQPQFASSLAHLVKNNGLLIVTTPNRLVWHKYWRLPNADTWRQPVEDWTTPSELRSLLRHDFTCLKLLTFNYSFTNEGIHRVVNSQKLNALAHATCLQPVFSWLKSARYGLYTLGIFKRRSTT